MIDVQNLAAGYASREVLSDVSFRVGPGEAAAYLGANGAGKSTTVKIIAGLLRPASGRVTVGGHDVAAEPLAAKRRLGYVPDDARLYESLTPAEYLSLVAELYHLPREQAADRINQMAAAFELTAALGRTIETLSRGQRQKVLLIAALVHDPDVLLLDEPLNGLDVESGLALRRIIEGLLGRGKTILFCSHILELVERVCARTIVLYRGRIVADGATADLVRRSRGGTLEAVFRELTRPEQADEGARAFFRAFEEPAPSP
ncbi:MAG: ABC transporter ATP-binding protein [Planctomycetes bacterium]|nr:ABC transporter ATP-binding protein [Planctomycetota bacterium]